MLSRDTIEAYLYFLLRHRLMVSVVVAVLTFGLALSAWNWMHVFPNFFDLYPPFWRFQLQGRDAIQEQLRKINHGSQVTSRILRLVPTADGFLLEHEETQQGERTEVARKLWHCVVRDDQIVEATCYCNGGWDDELRARHAAEAPMLRP